MEVVLTNGKLKSNCHHQQTNTKLFTGRMPFLSPKLRRQSIERVHTWLLFLSCWNKNKIKT